MPVSSFTSNDKPSNLGIQITSVLPVSPRDLHHLVTSLRLLALFSDFMGIGKDTFLPVETLAGSMCLNQSLSGSSFLNCSTSASYSASEISGVPLRYNSLWRLILSNNASLVLIIYCSSML